MAGDEIKMCGGFIVSCQLDSTQTAALGDFIERSTVTAGRVASKASSLGTFGMTANIGGNNDFIKVWVKHNEVN